MKKEMQIAINAECEQVSKDIEQIIHYFGRGLTTPLNKCSACILHINGYKVLQSYNTIVAAIGDNEGDTCYDFSRLAYGYTATTSQHIAKFCKKYGISKIKRYYPV